MRIHAILGATGTGKTAVATAAARRLDAPVVVLDRIQCFTDIPTTSGRPPDTETAGITRLYLGRRRITDGDFPAADAHVALLAALRDLAKHHDLVLVEGGSMSLLAHLHNHMPEFNHQWHTSVIPIPGDYVDVTRRRVIRALRSAHGRSCVDEFRAAWAHTDHRGFVASICGFDSLLAWCATTGIDPADLHRKDLTGDALGSLLAAMVEGSLAHGVQQQTAFLELHAARALPQPELCCQTIDELCQSTTIDHPGEPPVRRQGIHA